MKLKLSNQAIGAIMLSLQKGIMEQLDITGLLQDFELIESDDIASVGVGEATIPYVYFCNECNDSFEVKHSLQKVWAICDICNTSGSISRKPVGFFLNKKQDKLDKKMKPGTLVKDAIKEMKEDLRTDQQGLGNRGFKDVK